MTKRNAMTALRRARIFDAAKGACHLCGQPIMTAEKWEVEHVIALECGGLDDDANLRPAHVACHKIKTAQDHATGAKLKRIRARHVGAHRPEGKIHSAGFHKRERNPDKLSLPPPRPLYAGVSSLIAIALAASPLAKKDASHD